MDATRRAFLQAGAGGLMTLALPGCCLLRPRQLTPFCPNDPDIASATTPLTVDVHAHIFNGTDLQVKRFIELVVDKQNDTSRGPPSSSAESCNSWHGSKRRRRRRSWPH